MTRDVARLRLIRPVRRTGQYPRLSTRVGLLCGFCTMLPVWSMVAANVFAVGCCGLHFFLVS